MPAVRLGDVDLYYELIDCTEPWRSGPPPAVRLAGAGHLSNMERPQEFNRAVLDFLGV